MEASSLCKNSNSGMKGSIAFKRKRGRFIGVLSGYLFLVPAFTVFTLFILLPMINAVKYSFFKFNGGIFNWAGFGNYSKLLLTADFFGALKNTMVYSVLSVILGLIFAAVVAFLIEPVRASVQSVFKGAFYLPGVVPGVAVGMVWMWLLNADFGLLNYLLDIFGIEPVIWLGNLKIALVSLVFVNVLTNQGGAVLIILASLGTISKELYESAEIDGASILQQTIHIKLPLLKPTVLYLVVITTIGSFKEFVLMYIMTNGGPSGATTTLGLMIYKTAFDKVDFGLASAQTVVLMMVIGIIAYLQIRILSKGE